MSTIADTDSTTTTTPTPTPTPTTSTSTSTSMSRPAPAAAPSIHRRTFLQWLAVYPSITVANLIAGPAVKPYPLLIRMLVITLMVIPFVGYVVMPRLLEADARLTRARRIRRAAR